MEKLSLKNWNDKRATDLITKIDAIDKKIDFLEKDLKSEIEISHADTLIEIPCSFNPGEYKL